MKPTIYFQDIAERSVDLRSSAEIDNINTLRSETPALSLALTEILKYESNYQFLPQDVCEILKKLVEIRDELFEKAPHRSSSDYIP